MHLTAEEKERREQEKEKARAAKKEEANTNDQNVKFAAAFLPKTFSFEIIIFQFHFFY